ncbi:TIGR03643 family protein [Aestuariibacter sp. AA17]|uniref:TIGR03643 family protein n=1 Tax=Fluctibacter corallii TaxID=2984329 RepID=A0ABT3A883_9ALTE|nr:TIGR03643 family protein [Aestuariibacter sp. AA17]MCV2884869.1 TIGR03643 family protein [Aestuariibacter sp. AA17]
MTKHIFTDATHSRIIEMAWEDRTPFEAIERLYGLNEKAVIAVMRRSLKPSSFKLWRARVSGRKTKHIKLRHPETSRGYCPTQYKQR